MSSAVEISSAICKGQRYLFGGKEREHAGGRNAYDFGGRILGDGYWTTIDPRSEDDRGTSPYVYCGGDPINRVDRDGNEWKYVSPTDGGDASFEWVEPDKAYDEKGNIFPNHYTQAILFSREGTNGKFDASKDNNIGTSTATVYKADGTTEDFDACTNPSDPEKFATVPEGQYEAKVGKHKGTYDALRLGDVGTTNFYNNKINLGKPNPHNPNTIFAVGINIHRAGHKNFTGSCGDGGYVSMGCLLIDRNKWDDFIRIFNTPSQKQNTVGIIILR